MRTALALAAALAALPLTAAAASFTIRSEVDAPKIGVQDQVQLTITIEGGGGPDDVALPALTNLEVVGGPSVSTQVSIVNGRMSQSRRFTYVLRPRGVGKAEVGKVTAGGETAPPIAVEVVAGSARPREPRRTDPFGTSPFGDPMEELLGRPRGRTAEPKLFVDAAPSRTKVHVGEPLVLTYYLYTQVSVTDLRLKDALQFGGFWVEDLERPQASPSGEIASAGGESYRRFPVLQKLLFPTRAGTLTIPTTTFRIGLARQSFFDPGGAVERATKPLTITVDPLPDTAGFSGAVGRFRATASLDRAQVSLGEAATLRFRIEGTGNLKWVDRGPEVSLPGAKVYPPQTKSDLKATPQGVTGSRTWEFVVVPETSGAIEVPALAFSYFDPADQKIVTARTEPLTLRAEGGTAAAGVPPPPIARAGRAAGGLALRSDLDRRPGAGIELAGRPLAMIVGVVLLAHAGLWGAGRLRGAMRKPLGRPASPRSVRTALGDLDRAASAAVSKEQAAALVEKALVEAFGEIAAGDGDDRARAVRALLDEAQFLRYAPQLGQYGDKIRDLAARAQDAVRRWA